jgi:uncharacterized protein (DUF1330 family)
VRPQEWDETLAADGGPEVQATKETNMAKQFTVVSLTPTTDSWIPGYMAAVPALTEKHGGKYLVRAMGPERIEGAPSDADPAMIVILEWPSKDAESAFLSDPEYAPFHKARIDGAVNNAWSLPGLD